MIQFLLFEYLRENASISKINTSNYQNSQDPAKLNSSNISKLKEISNETTIFVYRCISIFWYLVGFKYNPYSLCDIHFDTYIKFLYLANKAKLPQQFFCVVIFLVQSETPTANFLYENLPTTIASLIILMNFWIYSCHQKSLSWRVSISNFNEFRMSLRKWLPNKKDYAVVITFKTILFSFGYFNIWRFTTFPFV